MTIRPYDRVPETKKAFGEITGFFDRHLGH
jgi:hypothetical protein